MAHLLPSSIEPDFITGIRSRFIELKIDTQLISAFGKQLVIDFRNVALPLDFTFQKDGTQTSLVVKRSSSLPPGFNLLSIEAWRETFDNTGSDPLLDAFLGTLDTTLIKLLTSFPFAKLTFTNIDENTTIFGARDQNKFSFEGFQYGERFAGTLVAGSGRRQLQNIVFDSANFHAALGLDLPQLTVENTLNYATEFDPRTWIVPKFVNLGALGIDLTAPRLTSGNIYNFNNVTVGPGLNAVFGSNFGQNVINSVPKPAFLGGGQYNSNGQSVTSGKSLLSQGIDLGENTITLLSAGETTHLSRII